MSKQKANETVKTALNEILNYFSKTEELKNGTQFTSEYKFKQLQSLESGFLARLQALMKDVVKYVEAFRISLEKKVVEAKRMFVPATDTSKLLYFQEKSDIKRKLENLTNEEIEEQYNRLLSFEDFRTAQMYEDEIMLFPKGRKADRLKLRLEKLQESRLPDLLKAEIEELAVLERLERTAKRILESLSMSWVVPAGALYAFINLSGEGNIYNSYEVAKKVAGQQRSMRSSLPIGK